jgi:hypothetical protein
LSISFRIWQYRRIIVTEDIISFSHEDTDIVIDCILLKEVESVQDMSIFKSSVDKAKFHNAFMITTTQDGSNEGRIYYLQAETEDECASLSTTLEEMAARARKKAQTESRFRKIQFTANHIYSSRYFRHSTAILILAVRNQFVTLKS